MNDGKYLVYNKQLLNKRLYNSIYFDLLSYNLKYRKNPLINSIRTHL